ncbi:MAG TPA: hypothetical protein VN664_13370, partial [Burkholderiales bacterium]|nr:hypothetical protein [Burkholderiales bacterium]
NSFYLPFGNTIGETGIVSTGIAIANGESADVNVSVFLHWIGSPRPLGTLSLPAKGHVAFAVDQRLPFTQFLSGILEFAVNSQRIAVMGVQVDTSANRLVMEPALSAFSPGTARLAHLCGFRGKVNGIPG